MKVRIPIEQLKKRFPDFKFQHNLDSVIFTDAEKIDDKRTLSQNNSLHLMFQQLSDECLEKGIEMRDIVKDELPIECTLENIKWLWKKLQKALFKTESTTQLKKNGQIKVVYENFNKILIERTGGEICLPKWPCIENQIKDIPKIDYPKEELTPTF